MNKKPTNTIDAIAMKRCIQEQLYEDTKSMAPDEFVAYMRRRIANSQFADFLNKADQTHPSIALNEKTK
jgi:hypothetical protein